MKKLPLIISALLIIAILLLALSYFKGKNIPTTPVVSVNPITIKDVGNTAIPVAFDYGDGKLMQPLKNGSYRYSTGDSGQTEFVEANLDTATSSYASTDFNNDGAVDMFATVISNSGGTGVVYQLMAFVNENGIPKYAGKLEMGDRIQVNKISANKNSVTVDIITQGPGEPLCCGTTRQAKVYTFDGKAFVENK